MGKKITLKGIEYTIVTEGQYDEDGKAISFHAEDRDGKRIVIACDILDPDDPLCYDIERPSWVADLF